MICATSLELVWQDFPKFGVKAALIFQGVFFVLESAFLLSVSQRWAVKSTAILKQFKFHMYVRLTKENLELKLFQYNSNPSASSLLLLQI